VVLEFELLCEEPLLPLAEFAPFAFPPGCVTVVVVVLVSLDGLRTEHLPILWTIVSALVVGVLVAGAAALVGADSGHAGLRAAILLVLWYGGRGVAGAIGARARSKEVIAEYAIFFAAAIAGMVWIRLAHL